MKKKILYVVNIDSFFISHREDIALKAKSFLKIHLATKFKRNVNYFKKIIKPTDEEIKKHSEYLKQNLKKNFF